MPYHYSFDISPLQQSARMVKILYLHKETMIYETE